MGTLFLKHLFDPMVLWFMNPPISRCSYEGMARPIGAARWKNDQGSLECLVSARNELHQNYLQTAEHLKQGLQYLLQMKSPMMSAMV